MVHVLNYYALRSLFVRWVTVAFQSHRIQRCTSYNIVETLENVIKITQLQFGRPKLYILRPSYFNFNEDIFNNFASDKINILFRRIVQIKPNFIFDGVLPILIGCTIVILFKLYIFFYRLVFSRPILISYPTVSFT